MDTDLLLQLRQQERLLRRTAKTLDQEIEELAAAGLTNGRPTWNGGKYLYMYYPNPEKKGGRDRVYIGSDPVKIEKALAAVKRTEQHKELTERRNAVEALRKQITDSLEALHAEVTEAMTANRMSSR